MAVFLHMKSLLIFLFGAVAGIVGYSLYQERGAPRLNSDGRARTEWQQTGDTVKAKALKAGEKIGDAGITALIKAKYVLDRDLSASSITVETKDGDVLLTGTVTSRDLAGRAKALALDTDGVRNVTAKLEVRPAAK
jgi:hyperosmotically inducible protein